MRCALLLIVACVPPPVQHPAGIEAATCHLSPLPQGTLTWTPPRQTELVCTAQVDLGDAREVCFEPVVGVRQTGAVYTSHDIVCSDELAKGDAQAVVVKLDMPRELCRMDRGGCVVHAFTIDWPKPLDAGAIVTLARTLEAHAAMPGRDRPTVAECDALADRWEVSGRDAMIATCVVQSRATLACLQASADLNAARSCVP